MLYPRRSSTARSRSLTRSLACLPLSTHRAATLQRLRWIIFLYLFYLFLIFSLSCYCCCCVVRVWYIFGPLSHWIHLWILMNFILSKTFLMIVYNCMVCICTRTVCVAMASFIICAVNRIGLGFASFQPYVTLCLRTISIPNTESSSLGAPKWIISR